MRFWKEFILGFSEKIYFWGHEDFVDIFLGSSQNWIILRGHFYAFCGLFLRSRYSIGDIFWLLKLQIFFGVLEIPDIFWGEW